MKRAAIIWEPKLEIPSGVPVPDFYDGSNGLIPPDDFVICRKRDGSVASVYADLEWDVTAYDPRGRLRKLYFASWCNNTPTKNQRRIVGEIRWLMFLLMWKREGATLSVGSWVKYMELMRTLARFSNDNSCGINDVLSDVNVMKRYLERTASHHYNKLSSLLFTLIELGEKEVGFRVLGGISLKELRERYRKEYAAQSKQHPPIPTRIYSCLITVLMRELTDFESIMESYLRLAETCAADPLLGRRYEQQFKVAKRLGIPFRKAVMRPTLPDLLDRHGLVDYFESKILSSNLLSLVRGLSDIQLVCKLIIHAFSGMRHEEAQSLPLECLDAFKSDGKVHYRILGSTTKLNNGRIKRTRWLTSREGAQAIRVAQKVASLIYLKVMGDVPKKATSKIDDYPLFVSTAYFPFVSTIGDSGSRKYAAGTLDLCNAKRLSARLELTIEELDLRELEQIDPHRAWRSEPEFQTGQQWPLTTHQLRRSLALYASRSGLVSLPTLRRQLQHITEEMSRYYASGSAFAKNIIGDDKDHFGMEYQNAQPESQALAYIANVLFADEQLFGAHGTWVERNKRKNSEVLTLEDREKTIQKFKKGEMAYKETIFGGCTEIAPCDKKAMRSIIACLDCRRAEIRLPKLDRVILAQEVMVKQLKPNTMEWKTEKADLVSLQAARIKFEAQTNPKEA